ncbi:uncharacterized protein LOC123543364 isoform X2 [Mercenaria mercenaria]|uniref:uncharacterized protein LOC123543364 isoform X2 n=1 Tax=Mercenaria mercenaria TaxID=6596 RepID=UPI00234F85DF|nr:uncharacterized protein LOC123543364 isoform X2 [Mercenaria mercenaria]
MEGVIDDLGVAAFPDSSPSLRQILQQHSCVDDDNDWTDIDDDEVVDDNNNQKSTNSSADSNSDARMPATKLAFKSKKDQRGHHKYSVNRTAVRSRKKLSTEFPCQSRTGMSCAVDTAWHKRGFDSLTSHTFFMSKAKYGKKVVKSIVSHRTCGTCKWWKRNRPGQLVRKHRCVHSHTGSARLMESTSGEQGVKELMKEGTPIEYLEGDGDTTLIARLRNNLNINMKKRFDRNHIVKNIGKNLYALQASKGTKLSRNVILHIQKCLKYAFAKNAGNKVGLRENLKALIPHQFGDHTSCHERFCGYKRKPRDTYTHRSPPYKGPLKDTNLRSQLEKVFEPVIANAEQYANLGSSQQCEHANREVTLRAPKSLHYGNSESLDYRVQATAAFINEGRNYISQLKSSVLLVHTCVIVFAVSIAQLYVTCAF